MLCAYGAEWKNYCVNSQKKALFLLSVAFILFGLLEEAHQRDMRSLMPPKGYFTPKFSLD
jgi:hypothetical protein